MDLLEIQQLSTHFITPSVTMMAVNDVSLRLPKGRVLGLVGESGCGKTITALSILNLVPPPGRIVSGKIFFEGQNLLTLPPDEMRSIRGARIAMIFQEPMTALNPVYTVGAQIVEVLITHRAMTKRDARIRTIDLLQSVGIPAADKRVDEYPHQLSGGMRQRVVIAMAIACSPSLILADEPTTALDVTIQAHILELIGRIQADLGMAMILVTHDLGLVAERAHEVAVMYAGRIVEQADTRSLFAHPRHPYTQGLLASVPKPHGSHQNRLTTIPGSVPRLGSLPKGCSFSPRCPHRNADCEAEQMLLECTTGHFVRCWKALGN